MTNVTSSAHALQATANCNAGEVATGGSAYPDDGGTNTYTISQPNLTPAGSVPTGWLGVFRSRSTGALSTGTVYVICAK